MNFTQIKNRLTEHFDEVSNLGYEVFCVVLQGSQNYGLDIYDENHVSDVDSRAIVLPTINDICNLNNPISTTYVRHNQEHVDLKDLRLATLLYKKQNINALETLFSPYCIVPDRYMPFWQRLCALREEISHCHPSQLLTSMSGMVIELRKKLASSGDGKQLCSILRIREFIQNYVGGCSMQECLTRHSEENYRLMMDAKLNKTDKAEAEALADKALSEVEKIKADYITKFGTELNPAPYLKLDEIRNDIMTFWIKAQLSQ